MALPSAHREVLDRIDLSFRFLLLAMTLFSALTVFHCYLQTKGIRDEVKKVRQEILRVERRVLGAAPTY